MSDYTPSGNPSTSASGSSSDIRTEFGLIQTAIASKADATGSASFATVGTVTAGTWNATTLAVAYGGTGRTTSTTAYGLLAAGTTATGAHQTLAAGALTEMLVGGGTSALPVWTTATGSGAPVRATSPTLVTPKSSTTIGVGDADAAASGAGITFPASQSASTDVNTLDDYEEGTWTPVVIGESTAGTGGYSVQDGTYTKIGNVVFFKAQVTVTSHTGTGNMVIGELPFACEGSTLYPCSIYWNGFSVTSGLRVTAVVTGATTRVKIYLISDAGTPSQPVVDASCTISVSGMYRI